MARKTSKTNPAKSAKQPGKVRTFLKQVGETYQLAAKYDRLLPLKLFAIVALVWALLMALGILINLPWLFVLPGFLFGVLAATIYFGRRAERAAYLSIEGQPGAAAAVLQAMRGGWFTTPAVSFNRQQDCVHRLVCRAGVVLISEGPASRVGSMLEAEERKASRFAQGVTVTRIQSGNEPGQVPLRSLQKHLKKLPKPLKPAQVTQLRRRFDAVAAGGPAMPIPKGPMPRSAGESRRAQRGM